MVDSISKTPIARDAAAAITADALGDGTTLVGFRELTDGWFNAAYELVVDDGRAFVLKVAPPPHVEVLRYERDIIRAEIDALRLVRARTDAPVPEVVWVDDTCTRAPSPLFVMTRLDGASLQHARSTLDGAAATAVDVALGQHLRSINEITGDRFGLLAPTAPSHATWRSAFSELFEWVLADGERRHVALPVAYDAARHALAATAPALDEVTEPRLVYWDLWDGNVLVDAATGQVTGMLDLERAMWGDPLIEAQLDPFLLSPALLAGYGRGAPSTEGERARRALYTLYLHLVMSIEGTYRQYPEDPVGDWARSQLAEDLARVRDLRP